MLWTKRPGEWSSQKLSCAHLDNKSACLGSRALTSESTFGRYKEHIDGQTGNRRVDEFLQKKSVDHAKGRTPFGQSVCRSHQDGCDQAKFKMPPNISKSKEFENCWRPQLHFFGSMVFGLVEKYYVLDPDVKNDANLTITMTARTLQTMHEDLKERGLPMPAVWSHHCDNKTGEGKNQTVAKHFAHLTFMQKFHVAEQTQSEVGHTHGPIDQRFSVAAAALGHREDIKQCPQDVKEVIERRMKGSGGRRLTVELLHASYDWVEYYKDLEVQMMGHTMSHHMKARGEDACHVWRFICRHNVDVDPVLIESDWDLPPDPHDVIILVKYNLRDSQYAQPPKVFCPAINFRRLSKTGTIP